MPIFVFKLSIFKINMQQKKLQHLNNVISHEGIGAPDLLMRPMQDLHDGSGARVSMGFAKA